MQNPFAYSNYVTGESFCNRKKELSELLKYIKGSQNVLLFSHRRYGKSSLIRQVIRDIKEQNLNIGTLHVELYRKFNHRKEKSGTHRVMGNFKHQSEKNFKTDFIK